MSKAEQINSTLRQIYKINAAEDSDMNKLKFAAIIDMTVVIILELLPFGAVCNFAVSPEAGGGYIREMYSYFNLLPLGYANFGPFITAVLSCLLITLWIYGFVFESKGRYFTGMSVISAAAFISSLLPVLLGLHFCSVVGVMISALLLVSFFLSVKGFKVFDKSEKFA
jgi:hypothetical protein